MLFTDIRLQNFRSYKDASYELGEGVNIVVGPNAVGKTNLLEALILSSGDASYRGRDEMLIREGLNWMRVDTHTNTNQTRVIKYKTDHIGKTTKTYEIDEKSYKRFPINQKHPVVLFEPNHLFLLHAEPGARREYTDELITKLSPTYQQTLRRYKRALSQRNHLLKYETINNEQLFVWNIKLSELAEQIHDFRTKIVGEINEHISETYSSIAKRPTEINVRYSSKISPNNYAQNLLHYLEQSTELDRARGFTSAGPHRDDIVFDIDDVNVADRASRGEIRTLLLSLKIIELIIVEKRTGRRPILLLDDVFSELDGARRKALTKYLKDRQTIITTTDADIIAKNFEGLSNTIVL